MKYILIVNFLILNIFSFKLQAQKDIKTYLSQKEIEGTWQRGSKVVGNGLGQNFHFYNNGTFIINLGDDRDDLRTVINLSGKYRLVRDSLYFTILSKTIVNGKIGIDPGIGLSIFILEDAKKTVVKEPNPKELAEPCYITVITKDHIEINNEEYYRIK